MKRRNWVKTSRQPDTVYQGTRLASVRVQAQRAAVVAGDPAVCERKKGDLAQRLVYKFRSQGQLYLLGYNVDDAVQLVYLEAIGPHENFYRDLKRS
ncbi:MAG: hypothetical protein EPN64_04690 [Burkholderiaceae bacterium]|nr:MAG: hypothetical protein EPN64_04690 [Burkholderiaceae bacterium]